jgi:hypothetical protein
VTNSFSRFFLKSPLFRTVTYGTAILLICLGIFVISTHSRPPPVIHSVNPPIARSGEILTIQGTGFGNQRGTSVVTIGNSRITAARYLSWSDTQVTLSLPPNMPDGLVTVETGAGVSQPRIFTNGENIPVALRTDWTASLPAINGLSSIQTWPGALLTITGSKFGAVRGNSQVLFTAPYASSLLRADTYEYWSDQEIRVRIPDGASSGPLRVQTDRGHSDFVISVASPVGAKIFGESRVYALRFDTDVSNVQGNQDSALILRMPRPLVSLAQPRADLEDCSPAPLIEDFNNMLIHQIQLNDLGARKAYFSHTFVLQVYGVRADIDVPRVLPYTQAAKDLFALELAADILVKSDSEAVIALAAQVVQRETNPYQQARLLYEYIRDSWTLL